MGLVRDCVASERAEVGFHASNLFPGLEGFVGALIAPFFACYDRKMKIIKSVSDRIKNVSDSELLAQIRKDASSEREHGLAVIHQLREIALRRLDAKLGYSSLHKFCMEELKYSSGSAWRRIKAMEALEDLPELELKIAQGDLTLASVSQVQSFCFQKDKSVEEKKAILEQVAHLSKRETERVLATIAPLPERPEKLRHLDEDHSELRITLDSKTVAELDKIRDLIAHSRPGASYAEVISYLAGLGLKKLDPAVKGSPPADKSGKAMEGAGEPQTGEVPQTGDAPGPATASQSIPSSVRRAVWQRDRGRCGYRNAETGKNCGATAFLQLDHIVPRAKGGGNEVHNLRLRCQSHNLLAAIEAFGAEKMNRYLRK